MTRVHRNNSGCSRHGLASNNITREHQLKSFKHGLSSTRTRTKGSVFLSFPGRWAKERRRRFSAVAYRRNEDRTNQDYSTVLSSFFLRSPRLALTSLSVPLSNAAFEHCALLFETLDILIPADRPSSPARATLAHEYHFRSGDAPDIQDIDGYFEKNNSRKGKNENRREARTVFPTVFSLQSEYYWLDRSSRISSVYMYRACIRAEIYRVRHLKRTTWISRLLLAIDKNGFYKSC